MLPPHIRRPADAVFWIDAWLLSLGGEIVPGEYEGVSVIESEPGVVLAVQVGELRLRFGDGSELVVNVRLDAGLGVIKYTFDFIDGTGVRRWGWHGHQEPHAGFHHLHLLGRRPEFAPAATFEAVRERLLNE